MGKDKGGGGRHSVITASWLNSPTPTQPHLGNVVTIISTPAPTHGEIVQVGGSTHKAYDDNTT